MSVSLKTLRRFNFFDPVPDTAMRKLAAYASRHVLEPATWVIRQGELGDTFYMIVQGTIEIVSASDETQLNTLTAGQWFGDFALLDNKPRSASVRTQTRATLIYLPKEQFLWLVLHYPVVLHVLATSSQQRLRDRDRAYLVEVETRAKQMEQLYSTALDITRHLDRNQALEAIRQRAIGLLAADGGNIYLYNAQTNALVSQTTEGSLRARYRSGEGCVGKAYADGTARIEKHGHTTTRFELAAPIQLSSAQGQLRKLGVLYVYRSGINTPYTETDRQLLELFASQAAIVIENADLIQSRVLQGQMENELQNARHVQRQLIPSKPPRLHGYQAAALWYPAKEVSGDYYDFIPLADGRVAFVIADVSGKGLDAALFMANARATLRAGAGLGDNAVSIITHTNNALSEDSPAGMFVTAFFGILDPKHGTFTYINAGHNPPLLLRARTGQQELLATGNRALAITAGYAYDVHTLEIEPGDLLVMYTDGVTEASDAQDALFGMERLNEVIAATAGGTAKQVIREIDARVRAFTGAYPQSDDITVVTLRRM